MNVFSALETSASAMRAERIRAEVVTANLANAETTRTPEGGPYRRRQVVFAASGFQRRLLAASGATSGAAVQVAGIVTDASAPQLRYEPSHPDANADGMVPFPAIDVVAEMADLMGAVRSYQMNAAAVNATKQMIAQALDLLR